MPHVILGDLSASSVNMALLIARVVLGAVFLAHGINHIYGGGKIEGTGRWFDSLGMRPGILHAWMASLVEIVAGGLPGGAVAGKRELLDALDFARSKALGREKVGHQGTFNANPLSAAAAVATHRKLRLVTM